MNKKIRRTKIWLVGFSVLLLVSSTLGIYFPSGEAKAATPPGLDISYTSDSQVLAHEYKNSLKMSKNEKSYTQIKADAGAYKKITKIVFYRGTQAVKTINVQTQTFNQKVELEGVKTKVVSKKNKAAGSWIAFTRREKGDGGWSAVDNSNWEYIPDGTVTPTKTYPGFNSGDEPGTGYSNAPDKWIRMTIKYPRKSNFYNETLGEKFSIPVEAVDNRVGTIIAENPSTPDESRISVDMESDVTTGDLNISGKAHRSTHIEQFLVGLNPGETTPNGGVRDLNFATIIFTQQMDQKGSKYYVRKKNTDPMVPYDENKPNPQAMMFYYAAYSYNITSYTYLYPDKYRVFIENGPKEPSQGFCNIRPGRTIEGEDLSPTVSAVIRADQRDREPFDVLRGIPTSESLYGNVMAKDYLNQYKFQEQKVTCIYEVPVTQPYILKWDPQKDVPNDPPPGTHKESDEQTANEEVVYKIHTERYFTYWTVENLGIYAIDSAELNNYAFEGESISLYPEGYTPPDLVFEQDGEYTAPDAPAPFTAPPITIGPNGATKPSPTNDVDTAERLVNEKIGKIKGKNDKVVFKGQTIMDDREVEVQTPVPTSIPNGTPIGRDVLYSPNHLIPSTKTNRYAAPSMGTITYYGLDANYEVPEGDTYPIGGINSVTVHTPVVNYSSATDDQAHNQKTTPNASRAAFILDRPFTIRIPTSGQHANYPGYGDRDYQKYFRAKQVRFPFDTYTADRSTFYPAQTWIDIPVSRLDTSFFLPVWVDEGNYTVEFRNIAENAPDVQPGQPDANLDLTYHVASDTVGVEVIGRLYDFHLTDIVDYNWELVFRKQKGSPVHTGNTY